MKLRLRDRQSPPVQLRLTIPATLKGMLDEYVGFVRGRCGREVDGREVAVEMLSQFIESDREFRQWQKREDKREVVGRLGKGQGGVQVDGQASV